uniref:Uroporphyrinogen decarboxylase (URO-D) domain-containing protein n=1 Tax=Brassica campestris TaxID=3711 RepID=M4DWB4_BRACM
MLLIGSRVSSIQSHKRGLICHPRRFSNAAWSGKFVVDCSSFSSDTLLLSTAKGQAGNFGFRSYQTMSFIFSGILTPIPAFGFLFDNEEVKGPVIQYLIRPEECLKKFHPIDLEKLQFIGDSLNILRQEAEEHAKRRYSDTPIVFYTKWKHGSSSADVIGLDWTVDMADGKRRLGSSVRDLRVHGNVDPSNLLSLIPALTEEIYRWIVYFVELKSSEDYWTYLHGIYSNLGHGVLVGTPEEALAHFFETARSLAY